MTERYSPGQCAAYTTRGIKAGALVLLQRKDANGEWLSIEWSSIDTVGILLYDNADPKLQKVKAVPFGSVVLLLRDVTSSYVKILYEEHVYEVWAGNLGNLYEAST